MQAPQGAWGCRECRALARRSSKGGLAKRAVRRGSERAEAKIRATKGGAARGAARGEREAKGVRGRGRLRELGGEGG